MKAIVNHFTDNDLYTFTCMYYILQKYPRAEVAYQFFDRNHTKYPQGFDALLREQLQHMEEVVITEEEIAFMTKSFPFLPYWFINVFLRGYRFNPNELTIAQDEEGHLSISVQGRWWSAIMWEMPILATISELMHTLNGDAGKYQAEHEYEKSYQKGRAIWENGLTLGDMGTRRRFSFAHQERVIDALIASYRDVVKETEGKCGKFTGTSNVYFAMKKGIPCLGTMSHQCISFEEVVSGVIECNYNVMNKWSEVYDGNVGIFLYDCFGDDVFFNNLSKRMAMTFSGLRIDSGVEEEQVDKIVAKYKQLGIDPMTKQAVFSNGLNIERAIEIHRYCQGKITDSYGVGTFLTCDVTDCKPMNIVVKLVSGRITESREWHPCVKLSCDKGKTLGDKKKCEYLLSILG
ncbi:MAG: nicotinate phosphoribosyltransferase [Mediterranea massiliensis]|nr:nicotinate phosphoribosyltransferase [Mediterranea massiliensis]MBR4047030.1 nicotinate phosphoribosyltransferase [Bacteroides sp.]